MNKNIRRLLENFDSSNFKINENMLRDISYIEEHLDDYVDYEYVPDLEELLFDWVSEDWENYS